MITSGTTRILGLFAAASLVIVACSESDMRVVPTTVPDESTAPSTRVLTPTSTPVKASIQSLEIAGSEVPMDGSTFAYSEEVNPGDELGVRIHLLDDNAGTVQLFELREEYSPTRDNRVTLDMVILISPDLTKNELPLIVQSGDESYEFILQFLPGPLWAPRIEVDRPTTRTGESSIEVTITDLNPTDTVELVSVEQEFNRQDSGNKQIREYISNQDLSPFNLVEIGSGRWQVGFHSQWPGRFPLILKASDNKGNESIARVPIEVYWSEQPFEIRGVMLGGWIQKPHSSLTRSDFEPLLYHLHSLNINFISTNPLYYLSDGNSNDFIRASSSHSGSVPFTSITDGQMVELIELAHEREMGVMIKPMVFSLDGTWIGSTGASNPAEWMSNYRDRVVLPLAEIAQHNDVEMLSLFNDLGDQRRYASSWRSLIEDVRAVYDGQLTLADSYFEFGPNLPFADDLDIFGFQLYLSGSGYSWQGSGKVDPSVEEMYDHIGKVLSSRQYAVTSSGLSGVATEFGIINADGANQEPANIPFARAQIRADNQEQVEYYEATFRALSEHPWMSGLFVWSLPLYEEIDYHGRYTQDFRGLPAEHMLRIWYASDSD